MWRLVLSGHLKEVFFWLFIDSYDYFTLIFERVYWAMKTHSNSIFWNWTLWYQTWLSTFTHQWCLLYSERGHLSKDGIKAEVYFLMRSLMVLVCVRVCHISAWIMSMLTRFIKRLLLKYWPSNAINAVASGMNANVHCWGKKNVCNFRSTYYVWHTIYGVPFKIVQ